MLTRERSPPTVMILENEAIIAEDMASSFRDAGFKIAGVFYTCMGSEAWLKSETPEIAILDIMLNDGHCVGVVKILKKRNVPILIYSATIVDCDKMSVFKDLPRIEKPAPTDDLVEAARKLL